jgi:hypothetical protein
MIVEKLFTAEILGKVVPAGEEIQVDEEARAITKVLEEHEA